VTRAEHRTWYRIALARPGGSPVLVAAQGAHLGAAIGAAEHHLKGAVALAVEVAAEGAIPLGDSVGKTGIVELGPTTEAATFAWPRGIVPQLGQTAALVGARRGWVVRPDPQRLVIEAQTDREHLQDLYLGLVERLPSADNLEVRVLGHFEDRGATDVWLTSRVNANKIVAFLDDRDDDTIANGHVELSIYVRSAKATLRLTEHKTVVWISDDRALEAEVTGWLAALAVPVAPLTGAGLVDACDTRPNGRPAGGPQRRGRRPPRAGRAGTEPAGQPATEDAHARPAGARGAAAGGPAKD